MEERRFIPLHNLSASRIHFPKERKAGRYYGISEEADTYEPVEGKCD